MVELDRAVELAIAAFKEEFGEGAKFEEGDERVFQFNNCVLIIGVENRTLKETFIGGLPIRVNHTLKIYEKAE